MKSWKIGALAGLIAGIIGGLITVFIGVPLALMLGLPFPSGAIHPVTTITITITEIMTGLIWGTISGVIFAKIYNLLPSKGILKALIYALGLYLIFNVRSSTLNAIYGNFLDAITWNIHGPLSWLAFGLILGVIYESLIKKYHIPKEKLRITKHNIGSGIYSGAIAGLVGGAAVFFGMAAIFNPMIYSYVVADIGLLAGQLGAHALFNMVWGIVFGILFAIFYDRIPGKGVLKGLIFSMIVFFLTSFRVAILCLAYLSLTWLISFGTSGFLMFMTFGLLLGLLYKPPK